MHNSKTKEFNTTGIVVFSRLSIMYLDEPIVEGTTFFVFGCSSLKQTHPPQEHHLSLPIYEYHIIFLSLRIFDQITL